MRAEPIQPSPNRPVRRRAALERPPIQIGSEPPWGGFGSMAIASAR